MKKLSDISWNVTEEAYREDRALSYSTLSRYLREGFHKLPQLFDKIETPSLTFGSAVDAIITGGQKEFNDRFVVANTSLDSEAGSIIKAIYDTYKDQYQQFMKIPIIQVSQIAKQNGFWPADKWSDQARYNGLLKKGDVEHYYQLLRVCETKSILSQETYKEVMECVQALRTADATKFYFAENESSTHPVQRYYQLKFKAVFNGVEYRCMMDEVLVDYANKKIYPIDLKTSSHFEDEFPKSFIQWCYQLQARLYYRILKANLEQDDFFKDFEVEDYTFIVVSRHSLTPLTWRFNQTKTIGTITLGKNQQYRLKDPFEIGEELHYYLSNECVVPKGINTDKTNDIVAYLSNVE
jgi:hypothetical protein